MPNLITVKEDKLSDDMNGRNNTSPSIVRLMNGRMFIVYSKYLVSGRVDGGLITTTSMTVNVASGIGSIDGQLITFQGSTFQATPNSYFMVYVDVDGIVKTIDSVDITIGGFPTGSSNNKIILGFISSSSSTITYVENLEKYGHYLYCQKQELVDDVYDWTNIEYRLNSGTQPYTLFDSINQLVHISYSRDGSIYHRIVDPNDVNSLEFLPSYIKNGSNISLDGNISRSASVSACSSNSNANSIKLRDIWVPSQPTFIFNYKSPIDESYIAQINFPTSLPLPTTNISKQPLDKHACIGTNTYFECLSAKSSGATYQWYRNGIELTGETSSRLTVPVSNSLNGSLYHCRVDDLEDSRYALLSTYDMTYKISLPYVFSNNANFVNYIYSDVILNFFDSNNIVNSYTITTTQDLTKFYEFMNTLDSRVYTMGLYIYKHGLDNKPYETPIDERVSVKVINGEVVWDPSEMKVTIQQPHAIVASGGSISNINKTFEFTQVNTKDNTDTETLSISGSISNINKTFEFTQVNTKDNMDTIQFCGSCSQSNLIKTYEV